MRYWIIMDYAFHCQPIAISIICHMEKGMINYGQINAVALVHNASGEV